MNYFVFTKKCNNIEERRIILMPNLYDKDDGKPRRTRPGRTSKSEYFVNPEDVTFITTIEEIKTHIPQREVVSRRQKKRDELLELYAKMQQRRREEQRNE